MAVFSRSCERETIGRFFARGIDRAIANGSFRRGTAYSLFPG
ncbi:hypothetical protein V0288_18590 [Pannus brasiliensis CCIBt3594]|uniref:Uncharacterized protein n=1 Tax=Pannus brasiliensis CCIBt3594 TaxID=1427578 RepID=A0AAW9QY49_9CHRO